MGSGDPSQRDAHVSQQLPLYPSRGAGETVHVLSFNEELCRQWANALPKAPLKLLSLPTSYLEDRAVLSTLLRQQQPRKAFFFSLSGLGIGNREQGQRKLNLRSRRLDEEDRKWAGSLPSPGIPNGTQVSAQEQYSLPRGLEGLPDILWKQVPSSLQAGVTQEVGQRVTSLGLA